MNKNKGFAKEKVRSPVKPIICSKCGHKVGTVSIKPRFNRRIILWGIVIALSTEIVSQITAQVLLGNNSSIFTHFLH